MKLWQRHEVLKAKWKREHPHLHRWDRFTGGLFDYWRCSGCKKKITSTQMYTAGRDGLAELFLPIVEDQIDDLAKAMRLYR